MRYNSRIKLDTVELFREDERLHVSRLLPFFSESYSMDVIWIVKLCLLYPIPIYLFRYYLVER